MKVIAITNQKGGVGKTSTSVHDAFYLAQRGHRVLFLDLDDQANASYSLGEFAVDDVVASMFFSPTLPHFEDRPGITLVRADPKLVAVDRAELSVIANFMKNLDALGDRFDVAIIDTSPSLGVRTSAALFASDYVLSPIQVEGYSIQGVKLLLQTVLGIQARKKAAGKDLVFLGMLPNMVNNTSPMHKDNLLALTKAFPQYVLPLKISNRTSIGEALIAKKPVWEVEKSAAREAGREMRKALECVHDLMELKPREVANG